MGTRVSSVHTNVHINIKETLQCVFYHFFESSSFRGLTFAYFCPVVSIGRTLNWQRPFQLASQRIKILRRDFTFVPLIPLILMKLSTQSNKFALFHNEL